MGFKKFFKNVWDKLDSIDERWYDFVLIGVALILIGVVLFGEKKHKMLCCGYFLIP